MDDSDVDAYFGVLVENEMDEIRLEYLLASVGPEKLFRSVAKYSTRYPGSRPYVSTILKQFNIRVPSALYVDSPVKNYHVYLLVCADFSSFKIGTSGCWQARVRAFSRNGQLDNYDAEATVAIAFADKIVARRAETAIKAELSDYRVSPPTWVPYGAFGHTEWRSCVVYNSAVQFLRNFESCCPRAQSRLDT